MGIGGVERAVNDRRFRRHAALPGAVILDGSIALLDNESSVLAAGGAAAMSAPAVSAVASAPTMYCSMVLSFASPLAMMVMLMCPVFAAVDA
jgi:hypothetical protein